MPSILVPVAYGLACHNAYRYALHLAGELHLDVVLAHYYSGSIDPRSTLTIGGDGTIQGSHLEHLRQFAHFHAGEASDPPTATAVTYETDVSLLPSAAIMGRAEQADITMVVMATRSSGAVLGKWLGSTATTVSEACARPVFLVPPGARYRPYGRMVVANNRATADPLPLGQLGDLARHYGAKVYFVHVEQPRKEMPLRFVPWELMEDLAVAEQGQKYAFEVVSLEDSDVSRALMDYAEDVGAELLVIVNRTRERWQAVLRATLTQDLALRSRLPVLVLQTAALPPKGQASSTRAFTRKQ